MELYQLLVPHYDETVSRDVLHQIIVDRILVQVGAFDEQLGVKVQTLLAAQCSLADGKFSWEPLISFGILVFQIGRAHV